MKFFLTIFLLSALMLTLGKPFSEKYRRPKPSKSKVLTYLPARKVLLESFEVSRNGHALRAFLTGEKEALSPKLKSQFDQLELGFLFSPSGLHLSGFLLLWVLLLKKYCPKRIAVWLKFFITLAFYFFPSFAIKRIVILRVLYFLKGRLKKKWKIEPLFFLTFILSWLCGHYEASPAGFIMSFLFMGTFISLRDQSRLTLILGLFTSHLLISAFNGNEVSLPALLLNIPLLSYFTVLMALSGFYLLTFQLVEFNWIEPLIAGFLWLIKKCAKLVIGTHINASLFLLLGMWIYFFRKDKKLLVLCFFLHANLANSPSFFVSGSWTRAPGPSADKQLYYSAHRVSR